ncbi:HlyD family secretion protein [Glaciecola siphonariae]|uniref:HlyD family secretion protein n=1 Tax=Glaciecola siphonariae TaxID=521012 RepID=A0ABV9LY09_9ALTE
MQQDSSLYRQEAWQALTLQQHGRALLLPSFNAWLISLALIAWVIFALFVLNTHSFKEKATVSGYLSHAVPSLSVVPKEGLGLITQVHVKNGQHVEKGERLLTIQRPNKIVTDTSLVQSQLNTLNRHLAVLEDAKAQSLEQIQQEQQFVAQELLLNERQAASLHTQVQFISQRIAMSEQHLKKLQVLVDSKSLSQDAFDNAAHSLLGLRQQASALDQQLTDNAIRTIQLSAQQARLVEQKTQQGLETQLTQLPIVRQVDELNTQHAYTLYAARSGIVSNLHAQVGDDISGFPVLMKLSQTKDSLKLHLAVPTSAAGFLKTQQPIRVRLDAFAHQKYGTLSATITQIASSITLPNESKAHAISVQQPVFMVEAGLAQSHIIAKGEAISLKEGMTVQADVILSERTLMQWLLSPLYSLKGSI